ncbi:MAG: DUF2254 family protein, partial [Gemmatimonadota bacterium]|nr:DUF2254 family protein [Gemmatimonadota bacterium]
LDTSGLVKAAREHGVLLDVAVRPGDFVIRGEPLGRFEVIQPSPGAHGDREDDREALVRSVRRAFILGKRRTEDQDPRFVLSQLVEIAVRALSPGINDPITACNCIHRLGAALAEVARRPVPAAAHRDEEGNLRLRIAPITFPDLLADAYDPIREHAGGDTMVETTLLDTLRTIGRLAEREADREALERQAEKVRGSGD